MLCDPLTKAGPKGFANRLIDCMTTGHFSLEPTVESQMKKLKQQKARMEKTLSKASSNATMHAEENIDDMPV